ncbi:MAG: hypothetical protein QUS33_14385 [Dehalococcoidia bacterium]|nr:hypothetical protein [Dehalococcoidia bacterium]
MSAAIRLVVALCMALVLTLGLVASALAAPEGDGSQPLLNKVVFVHQADEAAAGGASPARPAKPAKEWYKYSGIHWDDDAIPVCYKIGGTDNLDFLNGILASFQTWEDDDLSYIAFECDNVSWRAVPSSFETNGYANGYNEVGWASLTSSYPNAIAVTMIWYGRDKHIVEVDTALNSDLPWTQNQVDGDPDEATGAPGYFDVQDIMTHEAGHWLMLLDLYQKAASEQTMYGYGSTGEVKARSLESGDIAGLRKIYPGA